MIENNWIQSSINAQIENTESDVIIAGCDIGVTGDKTIITYRSGNKVLKIEQIQSGEIPQTAMLIHQACLENGVDTLVIDSDGVGRGAFGILRDIDPPYTIDKFHGNGKVTDEYVDIWEAQAKDVYYNRRSQAWHKIARLIRNSYEYLEGMKQCVPDDMIILNDHQELAMQLSHPVTTYKGSKLLIESKQDMKKRGIKSPDIADSLVLAFANEGSADWIDDLF